MVYGSKRVVDAEGRIRLDARELTDSIQQETLKLMEVYDNEKLFSLNGTQMFISEFYQIHGFGIAGVNEIEDVNLDTLNRIL
jgi:enoyl-[acyl-carrier protein] reductase/trans-2-enoyl-CoA reductase (NAD+)